MVEASLVSYVELGVLVVGVAIALQQLRDIKQTRETELETRQAQLFMDIYKTWASKDFQKDKNQMLYIWEYDDIDDFYAKYGEESNIDDHSIWDQNSMWLEGIGVLVNRGLIDPELIFNMQSFTGEMLLLWKKFHPFIRGFREMMGVPEYMQEFEYLNNVIKQMYEREYPTSGLHQFLRADDITSAMKKGKE